MKHNIIWMILMVVCGCHDPQPESSESAPQQPQTAVEDVQEPVLLTTCPQQLPEPYASDERASQSLIVVYKSLFRIGYYEAGQLAMEGQNPACFATILGSKPWVKKVRRDGISTPEGWYHVARKRDTNHSPFHRDFQISYPNRDDLARAHELEIISDEQRTQMLGAVERGILPAQNGPMGGQILIHGEWDPDFLVPTAGCAGVHNQTMDWFWDQVNTHDPILITPYYEGYDQNGIQVLDQPAVEPATYMVPLDPTPRDIFTPETTKFREVEVEQCTVITGDDN